MTVYRRLDIKIPLWRDAFFVGSVQDVEVVFQILSLSRHIEANINHATDRAWAEIEAFEAQLLHLETFQECVYGGSEMLVKVKRGWPVAKSIRNTVPILYEVLKPYRTFRNELPNHFR